MMTTEAVGLSGAELAVAQRFPTLLQMSDSPVEQLAEAVIKALLYLGCRKYGLMYEETSQDDIILERMWNFRVALQKHQALSDVNGGCRRKMRRYDLPVLSDKLPDNELIQQISKSSAG